MDSTKIGILKKSYGIMLNCFLKRLKGRALKSEIRFLCVGYLADETLKWLLADQQLCRFLVAPDFSQSNCARFISMRFFDTTGAGMTSGVGSVCFGGEVFSWTLAKNSLTTVLYGLIRLERE
jgi:hypothetical protein